MPRNLAALAALLLCSCADRASPSLAAPSAPVEVVAEVAPATPEEEPPVEAPLLEEPPSQADLPAARRIGSLKWYTYIWPFPRRKRDEMAVGRLRVGTSVALKRPDPVPGENCKGKWFAVEPRGFVCTDETSTFDLDSPYFRALASVAPGPGPSPYRYAFSTGAPMYARVPTEAEQEECERVGFGPKNTFTPLGKWSEGHEWLVDKQRAHELSPDGDPPAFFKGNEPILGTPWNTTNPKVRVIPAGSGFSYARVFRASGRVWLLTPELFLVPADRAFAYTPNTFHGTPLGQGVELPLAWVRAHQGASKLRRTGPGDMTPTDDRWANKAFVQLTGETEMVGRTRHWQTREEPTIWLAETDAVAVVEQAKKLHQALREDEKWVEARLLPGTMTAYEGKRAVYTTMWSGGRGGVPSPGRDPKKYATTELGLFSLQWKDRVATMSPDVGAPSVFWFGDVPSIQYLKAPLALHVSYWHDNFGHLMSAECLNVSPEDGAWLFEFTEPRVPEGWGAVRPSALMGPPTRIHIKAQ